MPKNLKDLGLNFIENNIGENPEDMKYLGQGLKELPSGLWYLTLNFARNDSVGSTQIK